MFNALLTCLCGGLRADFERVNWVNMVFTQLWPYLSAYISAQAHPQLDPLLDQNKPGWMDSIKLIRCAHMPAHDYFC
jgi:Ca2+-dependent lipid-binding protein